MNTLRFLFILEVCFIVVGFGFLFYRSFLSDYDKVCYQRDIYEKIIKREYSRTFDSYEDYLVYRIEIGE